MIRVLLVDDQALIRQAISVMLDATDDITIVGQGDTGLDAIAMAQRLQPDVVLMDIRMPELDGIAATEKICGNPDLAATRVAGLSVRGQSRRSSPGRCGRWRTGMRCCPPRRPRV